MSNAEADPAPSLSSEQAAGAPDGGLLTDPATGITLASDGARAIFRLMVRTAALVERLLVLGRHGLRTPPDEGRASQTQFHPSKPGGLSP